MDAALRLGEVTVQPAATLKLLGVLLDKTLSGRAHMKVVQGKIPATVAAIKTLSGSTWGANMAASKQLYC